MLSRLFGRSGGAASAQAISYDDLRAGLAAGDCTLIDVREPGEFAGGHVAGASNMPLSRFDAAALPREKKVVLICLSGMRSGRALRQAQAAGLTDVRHFAGGVSGWRAAGGALTR